MGIFWQGHIEASYGSLSGADTCLQVGMVGMPWVITPLYRYDPDANQPVDADNMDCSLSKRLTPFRRPFNKYQAHNTVMWILALST